MCIGFTVCVCRVYALPVLCLFIAYVWCMLFVVCVSSMYCVYLLRMCAACTAGLCVCCVCIVCSVYILYVRVLPDVRLMCMCVAHTIQRVCCRYRWRPFEVTVQRLCNDDWDRQIQISCWHVNFASVSHCL